MVRFLLATFLCVSTVEGNSTATGLTKHHFSEPHLGTVVHLVFYSKSKESAAELAKQCFQRVVELDAVLSDYQSNSELSKLCKKQIGEPHQVSDDLFTVLEQAQKISSLTDGAFDITIGNHSKRWRERKPGAQSDDSNFRSLVLVHQKKTVTLLKPLTIDLGGIGKGYIADQLMLLLNKAGVKHAAVNIGGETVLADAPPGKQGWKIGIENPEHEIIGTLELSNTAISTSGDSFQFFENDGKRQSHLIDPATKKSKANRLNVTTIAPTSMQADAWATALRILPTEKALSIANQQKPLEALFIPYRQARVHSKNFPNITESTGNDK